MSSLAQLSPGHTACVTNVGGAGSFRRRLLELGLVPGTEVTRTGQAALGDPLNFLIRGATVCLRRTDADRVLTMTPVAIEAK
ncbi:MAG: ferrous iron transport protein A [Deltaproteobacteria bacterium]|nr:ferrous iron transport protein A [Deltaproteobacteria bacterium]